MAQMSSKMSPRAQARYNAMAAAARRQRRLQTMLPWLVIIGMFGIWEIGCNVFKVPEFILPAPHDIYRAAVRWWQPLLQDSLVTLYSTMMGFGLAIVAGVLLGIAIGSSTLVYKGLYPLLIAFNSIPKVAVVPVLIIWFGIGVWPAVITAFLISFFPIVVNVATGIATVEPELEDVMKTLKASKTDILWNVSLPRAMPYFFAALKVAITLAFVGSVVAETVASNRGIGNMMMIASSSFNVPLVFAGLFVLAGLGVTLYVLFSLIERRVTGWAHRKTDVASA